VFGFAGFGAGLPSVPLLALVYGPAVAVVITVVLPIPGSLTLFAWGVRNANWREVLPILAAGAIAAQGGAWLLLTLDPETTRRAIGGVVLTIAVLLLAGWRYRGRRTTVSGLVTGVFGGVVHGSAGIGGPVTGLYLLSSPEPATTIRANAIMVSVTFSALTLIPYALGGAITETTVVRIALLLGPYLAGAWAGAKTFHRASDAGYRKAALVLIAVMGVAVLFA
jgi:uncharacterized membrane protein YfcA